jgi:hypothetical protein
MGIGKGRNAQASSYRRGAASERRRIRELKTRKHERAATEKQPPAKNPYQRLMEKIDRDNGKQ